MTIKELDENQINNLTYEQLATMTFGPVCDMLKQLSDQENYVVSVYGATIFPIKRRINALIEFLDKYKVDSVILSGGYGWQGVSNKDKTEEEYKKIFIENKDKFNILKRRINDIFTELPELKQKILNEMYPNGYEDKKINEMVFETLQSMFENKSIQALYEHLYIESGSKDKFIDWLKSYYKNYTLDMYAINMLTEATIMENCLLEGATSINEDSKLIKDNSSFDTRDNARNSINEFLERKKQNPNLTTLVIINEWPYLQRAVQTTKKIAKDMGVEVNIIGYPAAYSEDKKWYWLDEKHYKNNPVSGTIPNLQKEHKYEDSLDFEVGSYLEKYDFDKTGIIVGNKSLEEVIAFQNKWLEIQKNIQNNNIIENNIDYTKALNYGNEYIDAMLISENDGNLWEINYILKNLNIDDENLIKKIQDKFSYPGGIELIGYGQTVGLNIIDLYNLTEGKMHLSFSLVSDLITCSINMDNNELIDALKNNLTLENPIRIPALSDDNLREFINEVKSSLIR